MGNHGSEVGLITAQTGKGLNVRRVAERSVVATKGVMPAERRGLTGSEFSINNGRQG
jgi:hypothetical protein